MNYRFNKNIYLFPYALIMNQAKVSQTTFGFNAGYQFSVNSGVFAGLGNRLNDAIIATAGVEFQSFRLGFSYDVTTSGLSDFTGGQGGFELSLTFIGVKSKPERAILPALRYF
jgi:hypothetical protein